MLLVVQAATLTSKVPPKVTLLVGAADGAEANMSMAVMLNMVGVAEEAEEWPVAPDTKEAQVSLVLVVGLEETTTAKLVKPLAGHGVLIPLAVRAVIQEQGITPMAYPVTTGAVMGEETLLLTEVPLEMGGRQAAEAAVGLSLL